MEKNPFLPDLAVLPNPRAHLYDGVENVLYYGDINSEVRMFFWAAHYFFTSRYREKLLIRPARALRLASVRGQN